MHSLPPYLQRQLNTPVALAISAKVAGQVQHQGPEKANAREASNLAIYPEEHHCCQSWICFFLTNAFSSQVFKMFNVSVFFVWKLHDNHHRLYESFVNLGNGKIL